MDWSLIIFVVVIALFAWRGFRSGFLKSLGRIGALLAGYAAAIGFATTLAPWFEGQFGLAGAVAFLVASLALFFGAGLVVMLVFALLQRFVFRPDERSTASAVGGGAVGALVGALLAFAIVWSYAFVRDMLWPAVVESVQRESASAVEELANRLAGNVVSAALEAGSAPPEVARLSGALMAAPADVTQRLQRLTNSTALKELLADPRNRRILDSGKPEMVQQLPAFRALAANDDLQALAQLADFGQDGDFETQLAQQLTDTWQRAQRVKNHPRVQEILSDPAFRATLESGNPVTLLTDEQLLELADILFADEATGAGDASAVPAEESEAPAEPTPIYQWTDSSGRIHYSDTKPEN